MKPYSVYRFQPAFLPVLFSYRGSSLLRTFSRISSWVLAVAFCTLTAAVISPASADAQAKKSLGWVEKVKIMPEDLVVQAKLDTGAENSSLHAANITEFKKEDKTWIHFDLTNRYGKTVTIEREVLHTARVRSSKNKIVHRPVVRLGLCLGIDYMEVEVNLRDRTGYEYPMLIGRSFLAGNIIVDPAVMFTAEPNCKVKPAK